MAAVTDDYYMEADGMNLDVLLYLLAREAEAFLGEMRKLF